MEGSFSPLIMPLLSTEDSEGVISLAETTRYLGLSILYLHSPTPLASKSAEETAAYRHSVVVLQGLQAVESDLFIQIGGIHII